MCTGVLVAVARGSALRPPVPGPDELRGWLDQLAPRRVELRLPRTTAGTSTSLVSALEALGIHRLFAGAELGRAIHPPPLDVADVRHGVHVALTEEGIDVAAATAILALLCDDAEVPVALTVDRPFFLCICDRDLGDVDVLGVIARP